MKVHDGITLELASELNELALRGITEPAVMQATFEAEHPDELVLYKVVADWMQFRRAMDNTMVKNAVSLQLHVLEECLALLRTGLPPTMAGFDEHTWLEHKLHKVAGTLADVVIRVREVLNGM